MGGASRDHFDLTRPFFDGLLSECSGEAMIIDGAEKAYKLKTAAQFEEVAMEFKTEVRAHTRVPEKFDRHARIAFPIFIGSSSSGFSTEDFSSNYYSPAELTTALRGALEHTDEYVWVYSQRVNLWRRPGPDEWPLLPVEYRDAMLAAHDPALALPTAVEEEPPPTLPHQSALRQNYPNPFNSNTVIRFDLPTADEVDLSLYNLAGQKVASLLHGYRSAGTFTLRWDGRGDSERELASGVYLYRLQVPERVETKKLLLLR